MHIGIVGGGPAGLVAAIAARQHGFDVTVFEQAPAFARLGGAIGIQCNGLQALDAIGVLERFRPFIALTSLVGLEAPPGRRLSLVDFLTFDLPHRGFAAALRSDLQAVLLEVAMELGIDVRFDHRCTGVDAASRLRLRFDRDRSDTVDLVLGCDGVRSAVRTTMGVRTHLTTVHEAYLRVVADCAHPEPDRVGEFWAADGRRAGAFPLPAGRTYMFCSVPLGGWRTILERDLDAWIDTLNGLGSVISTVARAVPDWRAAVYDELSDLRVDRWYSDRCVLVGDAAHAMTPNLGQGANSAMVDAVVFIRMLAAERSHWQTAARRYERLRKPFVTRIQAAALAGGRLGSWTSAPARGLRDALLLAGSRTGPLQRAAVRLTAGFNPAEQPYLVPAPSFGA